MIVSALKSGQRRVYGANLADSGEGNAMYMTIHTMDDVLKSANDMGLSFIEVRPGKWIARIDATKTQSNPWKRKMFDGEIIYLDDGLYFPLQTNLGMLNESLPYLHGHGYPDLSPTGALVGVRVLKQNEFILAAERAGVQIMQNDAGSWIANIDL